MDGRISFFKWSIIGKLLEAALRLNKKLVWYNLRILFLTTTGANPYAKAKKAGLKVYTIT